jgi:shikimate dehydrogenase
VTIPYKKTVIPFCDELSDLAKAIGSVNTLLRREDGSIFGDNTDAFGFETLLRQVMPGSLTGKKALVLGTGGASATVCAVLKGHGANVIPISRRGENNYENISLHADAALIVNTTPLGMYPNNGKSPLDLARFKDLEGVMDVIYNPLRTALLMQAEELGVPCTNGLTMLVAQAKAAAEYFLGKKIPDGEIDSISRGLRDMLTNIILIGMPGSGKSSLGRDIAKKLHMTFKDSDRIITDVTGRKPGEIIEQDGEAAFRKIESQVLADLAKEHGQVIATGGGVVERDENMQALAHNGYFILLTKKLHRLATKGRPLSKDPAALAALYARRKPLYEKWADLTVNNDRYYKDTLAYVLRMLSR